jgi:hypothetical protein
VMTGMGAFLESGAVRFSYRQWPLLGNARLRRATPGMGVDI